MEQNPRADRKTIEKNRRNQMKALYSELHSLVPHRPNMEAMSLPDQLEEASTYIKKLEKDLEELKEKRDSKMITRPGQNPNSSMLTSTSSSEGTIVRSPQIEIHEMGSALKVVLITGLDCQSVFNKVIQLIHEEEAEVVNVSFSTVGDTVFYTIQCQVGESGFACGAARIAEKLKKSFHDAGHKFELHPMQPVALQHERVSIESDSEAIVKCFSDSLDPPSGVVVKLQCNNTKRPREWYGKTDKNGFFLITLAKKLSTAGAHTCNKVSLVSSPSPVCKEPTYLRCREESAHLTWPKKPTDGPSKLFPFQLFTVGPFAFEPHNKCL